MAITRFEDLPSENSPINSENLNGNFDELGVKVGTSVDNNYRTNIIYNKNLLYEVTLTNEYRLNSTGGLINEIGWSTTDYIEVEENTEYIINITRNTEFHRICFYNNSKVFLSKDETLNATFTTPANTKYIRFSSYTADFSGGILQKGSLFTIPSIVVDNEEIYNQENQCNVGTSINSANRVNVLHSSNLWHYDTTKTSGGVTSTYENSTITLNGTATGSGFNVPTNLAMLHLNAGNYALKLTEISGTKPGGQSLIIRNITTSTNLVDAGFSTTNTYTFTLSSDSDIAVMVYFWSSNVFNNYKFGVQLQEGSTTNAYEPYVTSSINVDGEEIYSKDNLEQYSTGEIRIGTWIDGKPLYRKVFTITNPASTNTNYVSVSSLNIDTLINLYGYYKKDIGNFNIPLYDSDANYSVIFVNSEKYIRGRFGSADSITDCKVIIEYTKTTD